MNVFAPIPAVRISSSTRASVSLPAPVSVAAASVKLTSADSATVSLPAPPSKASLPSRPDSVSSPASPESTLSLVLPRSVSANAVPMTFSRSVSLDRVSVNPAATVCAVVTVRSRLTPSFASVVKSSVSVSAFATSTIVTFADAVPVKT